MCYSSLVDRASRKYARQFGAKVDIDAFERLYAMRERDHSLKIAVGMEVGLAEPGSTSDRSITRSISEYQAGEEQRTKEAVAAVEAEIQALEAQLQAKFTKTAQKSLDAKLRKRDKLLSSPDFSSIDPTGYRIYPFYFAPVIIEQAGQRIMTPMRYRVLPSSGVEVPGQYNVFNARRDSLLSARTWKPLFGQKHALFPFRRFFEWVERDGKKMEISFIPDGIETMWAACLYEEYTHPELGLIRSFAMVTDDPPPEIAAAGHDRCPIFLHEGCIADWLAPKGKSLSYLDSLLEHKQPTHFSHVLAA